MRIIDQIDKEYEGKTITEEELLNLFAAEKQKAVWISNGNIFTGSNKQTILKFASQYVLIKCLNYKKYLISKVYDTPKYKTSKALMKFKQLKININEYNNNGVYAIINPDSNEIYIGSTIRGFRKRFYEHKAEGKIPCTYAMLKNKNSYFEILWTASQGEDEDLIRDKEQEFLKNIINKKEYVVLNKSKVYYHYSKNKTIKKAKTIEYKYYKTANICNLELLIKNGFHLYDTMVNSSKKVMFLFEKTKEISSFIKKNNIRLVSTNILELPPKGDE